MSDELWVEIMALAGTLITFIISAIIQAFRDRRSYNYEDGAFYIITYALSNKMQQIAKNPKVAICGDWFTAHGIGENLGHILDKKNEEIADKIRVAFAEWYGNGHTNEEDPNTCILCIHLTDGVLMSHGTRYDIDFTME